MEAGFEWIKGAQRTAVYEDLGLTEGMRSGIDIAKDLGLEVVHRTIGPAWMDWYEPDIWP